MAEKDPRSVIVKERFEALTDAVFAITMTLMILDLRVPDNLSPNISQAELSSILIELLKSAETYMISFLILGIFWVRQQIQFSYIKIIDMKVLSINLLFLLIIGFVPFAVNVIKKYPNNELPYVVYYSILLLISLILLAHWYFASKGDNMIHEKITPALKKQFLVLSAVPPFIFLLAIACSFVDRRLSLFIVYLDPLFYFIYRGLHKKSE